MSGLARLSGCLRTSVNEPLYRVGRRCRETSLFSTCAEPLLARAFAAMGSRCRVAESDDLARYNETLSRFDVTGDASCTRACGFKVMYNQLPPVDSLAHLASNTSTTRVDTRAFTRFMAWSIANEVRVVHLVRRSHIRKAISHFRAEETGVWHNLEREKHPPPSASAASRYALNTSAFEILSMVEWMVVELVEVRGALRTGLAPSAQVEISYEALYDGHDARLQRVELSRLLALLVPDQGWQRELARRSFTSAYRAVGRRRLPCRKQLLQWRAVRTGILESIASGRLARTSEEVREYHFALDDCASSRSRGSRGSSMLFMGRR